MRYLIAYVTGKPLVEFDFGFSSFRRFVHTFEDGTKYVKCCGLKIEVKKNTHYDFKPVLNCKKNGILL